MIKMVRRPNESAERLISKFNKAFQAARVGVRVGAKRWFRKKDNRKKRRIKAIKREENRARRAKAQFR